ncbi:unnamed protein product [Euphydryas editha]|uniref:Uncharacterized protein n=1 Tax=Euphydryas editha TaxID=104508 RepID=A0AAU9U111_EUPED|nr:unnamed protein product [Euphydryas editha]
MQTDLEKVASPKYSTHPRIVDPGERVVTDRAKEDDGLRRTTAPARHQLHAHHLAVAHHDIAEHLHTTTPLHYTAA